MMEESPEAVAAMYLRATKLGSTKIDLDNFIKEQGKFQIRVKRKDGTEKLVTIDAKNRQVVDAGVKVETATYADNRHKVKPPPGTP